MMKRTVIWMNLCFEVVEGGEGESEAMIEPLRRLRRHLPLKGEARLPRDFGSIGVAAARFSLASLSGEARLPRDFGSTDNAAARFFLPSLSGEARLPRGFGSIGNAAARFRLRRRG